MALVSNSGFGTKVLPLKEDSPKILKFFSPMLSYNKFTNPNGNYLYKTMYIALPVLFTIALIKSNLFLFNVQASIASDIDGIINSIKNDLLETNYSLVDYITTIIYNLYRDENKTTRYAVGIVFGIVGLLIGLAGRIAVKISIFITSIISCTIASLQISSLISNTVDYVGNKNNSGNRDNQDKNSTSSNRYNSLIAVGVGVLVGLMIASLVWCSLRICIVVLGLVCGYTLGTYISSVTISPESSDYMSIGLSIIIAIIFGCLAMFLLGAFFIVISSLLGAALISICYNLVAGERYTLMSIASYLFKSEYDNNLQNVIRKDGSYRTTLIVFCAAFGAFVTVQLISHRMIVSRNRNRGRKY